MEGEARLKRRANVLATERELAQVNREIGHIVDAVAKGWADEELRARMEERQAQKRALLSALARIDDAQPSLPLNLGEIFAAKVKGLRQALEQTRVDPTEAKLNLRQLVEEIRLTPRDGMLAIDWKGNLEAGLAAVFPVNLEGYTVLVAGACNQRYLQLWSGAA